VGPSIGLDALKKNKISLPITFLLHAHKEFAGDLTVYLLIYFTSIIEFVQQILFKITFKIMKFY
jgi:hypothetical protein